MSKKIFGALSLILGSVAAILALTSLILTPSAYALPNITYNFNDFVRVDINSLTNRTAAAGVLNVRYMPCTTSAIKTTVANNTAGRVVGYANTYCNGSYWKLVDFGGSSKTGYVAVNNLINDAAFIRFKTTGGVYPTVKVQSPSAAPISLKPYSGNPCTTTAITTIPNLKKVVVYYFYASGLTYCSGVGKYYNFAYIQYTNSAGLNYYGWVVADYLQYNI
jgi:hypothetical protein